MINLKDDWFFILYKNINTKILITKSINKIVKKHQKCGIINNRNNNISKYKEVGSERKLWKK